VNFYTIEKIQKLLPELKQAIYRETLVIPTFRFVEGDPPGAERPEFDDGDWREFAVGERWGGYDVVAWFRATVEIPPEWRDGRVYLRFLVGPRDGGESTAETMLYVDGSPLQGIDIWHEDAWLPPELLRRGRLSVALRSWSGVLGVPPVRQFRLALLGLIDAPAETLYYRLEGLLAAIEQLDPSDLRRVELLRIANATYHRLDLTRPQSAEFYASAAAACDELLAALEELAGRDELKPIVNIVGHAHIDMAWLWRLGHTREKAARTFATALHLMRQYPEYRFMHSSPQLYEYLREDQPELYERVKAQIAAGAWEITGGMWIESDTNLVSGESLIRQFLHGTRHMRAEFGVESRLLWLPDVFGYSAALPQIARGCGMEYFLTTKISWSQFNRFPQDTFRWRGVDGTELLTHFVTTPERAGHRFYTYNGQTSPADVKGIWENYRQKDMNDELLLLYGWGDGGGGPTREMLESARLLKNLPGLPQVRQQLSEPYFAALAERLQGANLPVWDGELYLEYHRGTYTSQAQVKRANRLAELLYREAEWLNAMADTLTGEAAYPHAALDEGWKLLLLNQFHDILPGSSIRQVYEDAARDYARIDGIGREALLGAVGRLLGRIQAPADGLAVFNSLSWARGGLLSLPLTAESAGRTLLLDGDRPARAQEVEEEGERRLLVEVGPVPPLGYRSFAWAPEGAGAPDDDRDGALEVTPERLENRFYRIELNERGQIAALWDKRAARDVLPPGARANVLQAFTDKPMAFDAWDIDIYYQEAMREVDELLEATVEEQGPLRGSLRLRWRFHGSEITQRLTIYRDDPRIDFRSEVEWREQQTLLKAAFPVLVRATRATYEIQFGQVERPTHWNTSWDWARFEVPAQRWADLSEGDYGVALLNDCKYGHDIRDNVMRLTLIKSAIRPDAQADKGRHLFTYSLLPHQGEWRAAAVDRAGAQLNAPLTAAPLDPNPAGDLPERFSFAQVDAEHVVVETVKRAEDDPDAWVVRLYEGRQIRSGAVRLRMGRPIRRAQQVNMVEQGGEELTPDGDSLVFPIAPYEILTFKLWLA
jgi:alpha-mannosidase